MNKFGDLLKTYRLRCLDAERHNGSLTQERLAEFLEKDGVGVYQAAAISNWERGKNLPRQGDRQFLVGLIKTLHRLGGIQHSAESQQLVHAANYRPLDADELRQIDPGWGGEAEKTAPLFPASADQEAALPAATYNQLFGLESAIETLLSRLSSLQAPFITAIVGLGGSGKTALADDVARQLIRQKSFEQVVWITAVSAHALIPDLAKWIIPTNPDPENPRQLRAALKTYRYLVVIDGLEDETETQQIVTQLEQWANPTKFLLTTRHHPPPTANVFTLSTGELLPADAIQLLRHLGHTLGVAEIDSFSNDQLTEIYWTVGGHPMALRFITKLAALLPLEQLLVGWERGQTDHVSYLYTQVYYRLWNTLSSQEQQLLQTMLLTASTGATPGHLQFLSGLSDAEFWQIVPRLAEKCLLERVATPTWRYYIHSLTRQFLHSRQQPPDSEQVIQHVLYWNGRMEKTAEFEWASLDDERYNIFRAVQMSLALPDEQMSPVLRQSWQTVAGHLYRFVERRGHGYAWVPLLEQMITKFGAETAVSAQLLGQLGKLYRLMNQLPQAIEAHHQAATAAQHLQDPHEIALAYLNLGTDYYRNREHETAESYAHHALILLHQQEKQGREIAAVHNLLGSITWRQNNLPTAEEHLKTAVSIWQELNEPVEWARSLNNLALVLETAGQPEAALLCYAQAKTALTKTADQVGQTLIALSEGTLYYNLGRYGEAETVFNQIDLNFLRQAGHRLYQAFTLNNRGNIALANGLFTQAEALLQEAIGAWRQLGEHVELARSLGTLGSVFLAQGRRETAVSCYTEAIALLANYPKDKQASQLKQTFVKDRDQISRKNPAL